MDVAAKPNNIVEAQLVQKRKQLLVAETTVSENCHTAVFRNGERSRMAAGHRVAARSVLERFRARRYSGTHRER